MAKMGRPRTAKHGERAMYCRGCRCEPCRLAEASYKRQRKLGVPALTVLPGDRAVSTFTPEPGRLAAAIAEELEGLPPERKHSALAALALALAHDLDTAEFAASHASQARELQAVLTELRQGVQQQADAGRVGVIVPRRGTE
jgi:hypothetical protein